MSTPIQELLARNIKIYRKIKGYSQQGLAENAGLSLNYIGLVETEKKFPAAKTLEKIASALNINSYQLFELSQNDNEIAKDYYKEEILGNIKNVVDDFVEKHF